MRYLPAVINFIEYPLWLCSSENLASLLAIKEANPYSCPLGAGVAHSSSTECFRPRIDCFESVTLEAEWCEFTGIAFSLSA